MKGKKDNEPILVFEYYTALGIDDPIIINEAISMIDILLEDLKGLNIHFLISEKFKVIAEKHNYVKPIIIKEDFKKWLKNNGDNYNHCLFISSEENNNLTDLTKLLEEKNVEIYGSNSFATEICSDKFKTHNHLKDIVKQPKTYKFNLDSDLKWKKAIEDILGNLNSKKQNMDPNSNDGKYKLIAKPTFGVDCQDIFLISNFSDIAKIKDVFPVNSEILIQEFIHGDIVSVSMISNGEIAIPLTLNKQFIILNKEQHSYDGGELPYKHPLEKKAFKLAKSAVESIEGIKGFVGVDLILSENDVYFIEINSRFTTPYVGLNKIINFNIPKTIIQLLNNEIAIDSIVDDIKIDKKVKFIKKKNNLNIELIDL